MGAAWAGVISFLVQLRPALSALVQLYQSLQSHQNSVLRHVLYYLSGFALSTTPGKAGRGDTFALLASAWRWLSPEYQRLVCGVVARHAGDDAVGGTGMYLFSAI